MTPERWQQIEEIFNEALELKKDEREGFVRDRSGSDTELSAEVMRLLEQFDEASSFIEQPLYESARSGVLSALLDESDDDPMVGKVLGSYRIEREIGRGGMGAVYEAVRADGEFRLRVALKVVKRGVDTDFVLRRFRNERQILAALDHPFITRLLDGGTTDDGRPYFVMEYIDGYPLYRYCDKNELSISERLRLFCRVCEAVEYAHQKRVIHRDLKPSNIFITNDGTPRLLDFGIAKLLDPELAIDTLQPTATALRMMTVDYASPEQIRGEKVTFATDVYSLGVILFELLTGFRPYKLKSRSPHDVARAICDDDPATPSEIVLNTDEAVAVRVNPAAVTLLGSFGKETTSPASLNRELRGNIDNIILRALSKSPSDRHSSVGELRKEIERHLEGARIASPPSSKRPEETKADTGPLGKLVAVLPLSLMNPGGYENTDEAYLTVGLADAIITRLASVDKLTVRPTSSITRYNEHFVNPFRAGGELGVDYVLDGRIRRFGDRLRISLQLLDVKRKSAIWAGQFDANFVNVLELEDAISEQVAAALIPHLTGEDRQKLSKRRTNDPRAYESFLRGRFYWNQFTSESLPKALEAYQKAIEIDPEYALAYSAIADFYIWANIYSLIPCDESYRQAEASVRRALQLDPELSEGYASMGLILCNRFEYEKAEALHKRSLAMDPKYPLAHEWYAALLIGLGRFDEGMRSMFRAEEYDPLSLRTKILVIWCLYQTGQFEAALAKADQVIDIDRRYPQGHLQRGFALIELGRYDEAVTCMEYAAELMPGSALTEFNLAFAYAAAGRDKDALRVADQMEARSKVDHVKPFFLFFANVAAGRKDRAFDFLDKSVDEFDPWLIWLPTEAKLRHLHGEVRFKEALERTRRRITGSGIEIIVDNDLGFTSTRLSEAVTEPMDEHFTTEIGEGFLRRNRWRLGAVAAIFSILLGGYFTGLIRFEIARNADLSQQNGTAARSIAVLPFENATGDPANQYIAEGMSDSLLLRLGLYSEIRVMPRSAVDSFREKEALDARAVGRELGVDSVLSGKLELRDGRFAVDIRMIDVADGRQRLTFSFAETAERMLALQDTMSAKVIESLGLVPSQQVIRKSYTENNEAFQLFLKAEFSRQKASPAGITDSIDLYNRAIAIEPNYALAYQGLALAYRTAPAYGTHSPQEAYPAAKSAALKALSIDPSLGSAYVPLASIKFVWDWDFPGAENEYKQAIRLAPNNSEAHYSYGNFLVALGRTDEALNELQIAQQLDPTSLTIASNISWALYIAGRFDEAEAQIRQVLARDPTFARAHLSLGEIYLERGRYEDAINSFQRSRQLAGDPLTDMALGHVYGVAGRTGEARRIAADLEAKVMRKELSPFLPAVVHAGLNDKDKAFYWLERAYQERSNWLALIKVGRRLKNLHGDPRFDDLLKRIGFQ